MRLKEYFCKADKTTGNVDWECNCEGGICTEPQECTSDSDCTSTNPCKTGTCGTDNECYYTNSIHLSASADIDLVTRIEKQSKFHGLHSQPGKLPYLHKLVE